MQLLNLSLITLMVMFTSSCKIDLPGFKSEPKTDTDTATLSSESSDGVFKRYADYSKINDIGNYRFKRDDSGLVGSGKQISRSIRDLRNEVSSRAEESRSDRSWWSTFRFDMDSYRHPLHCGYTKGGREQRFISSEDALVLGLPDSIFSRKLCGSCVKIEYTDWNGKKFTDVAIIADKGYRNQMPSNQLDLSPGMASFFNNNGRAKNIGSKYNPNKNIKVTPVECIYNNQRKLSYYMEGNKSWFGINIRRLPLPLKGMSLCVKKGDNYVWREIYQERGNASRKWIFRPNDGYLADNEIKFRLTFLDDSKFYDAIDFTREKQYFGKNSFGNGSEDNCENIGQKAAHGSLVTPIVSLDEVTLEPSKDVDKSKEASAQSTKPAQVDGDSTHNQCVDIAPDDKYSCIEQKDYGKCDASWMVSGNFCQATCGRCSVENLESREGGVCSDVAPNKSHSCAEQKEWGKCERSWMKAGDFCNKTCGRCS